MNNLMRTKAVENAMLKASALTKPLNQSVGPEIYISEISNQNNINFRGESALSEVVVIKGHSNFEFPKIEFEKIKISSTVNVKFILK